MGSGKWEVGSKKWEVGGQKSNHAALSLNGQKSEIRSSNFRSFVLIHLEIVNWPGETGSELR